jgi:glycosyltransferase involved in cell wall biosynthesis
MTAVPYKVLLTTACFEPGHRAGGPIRSVARIIETASSGVEIRALTRDRDLGSNEPYAGLSGRWVPRGASAVYYLNTANPAQWRSLISGLRPEHFDLLYCNSLWQPYFSVLPIVAARLGLIPASRILIAPRGELSPGAFGLKQRKKSLFLRLWRPFLASKRVVWHASTEMEAADIRAVWPAASIEVVEDQTNLPADPVMPLQRHGAVLSAVFISRISPMKNLALALDGLARCTSRVDFSIYGPIEDRAYWSRCQGIIDRLPDNVRASYHGLLGAEKVRASFAEHDLFIFPTLGENFGHVIAESLSASCPVLCSDQTPWNSVLAAGGGLALADPTEHDIGAAVQHIADLSSDERYGLRRLAGEAYRDWRRQASNENILDRMSRSERPREQDKEVCR